MTTTLKEYISNVGNYPVKQAPCPYFKGQKVNLNSPRSGVLHTTEGNFPGSLQIFKVHYAPHFIIGLNAEGKPEINQLVPVGTIGAALVTHNNLAVVQIEMVGYSKEELWLPDEQTLDVLTSLMVVCKNEWGIPLTRPWPTGVYGRAGKTDHRNDGSFGKVSGWFSHGDVPSPDTHWDCGNLNWDEIFKKALLKETEQINTVPNVNSITPHPSYTISWAQISLNKTGKYTKLVVDNTYGPKTKSVIKKFQKDNGLQQTGDLNDETDLALAKAISL